MIKTNELEQHFGSIKAVGEFFGISVQAISAWGGDVPKGRVYELNVRLPYDFPPAVTGIPPTKRAKRKTMPQAKAAVCRPNANTA